MSSLMRNGLVRNRLMPDGLVSNNRVPKNLGFPDIRRLGADDLRACAALAVDRGWWPERAKWLLLLEASEAYGVDAPDGQGLAGSVVLTRWGADVAAIGMTLTASRYGGQGLGRALMEHALRAAGDDTAVSLFGTDSGRPLYEKLGFKSVRRSVAFRGHFHLDPQGNNSKKRTGRAEAAGSAALPSRRGTFASPPKRTSRRSSPWTVPCTARTVPGSLPGCPPSRSGSLSSRPARASSATPPRGAPRRT